MLGSCSKDDTEVTSVEVNGKIAFTASMQIGNATRTHLEETELGFDYAWDNGDMIGATINGGDEVIPFIASGSGTGEIGFTWEKNDLDYLGVPPYYLVYPYDKDAKVANYNVTMTIPSSQRYRENSFATMTAPAVQVISELENGEIPSVKMRPVASYVRVPVVGAGKLTKLSMTIQNADNKYYKLCGSASVNLRNIETAVLAIPGTDDSKVENVSSVSVSWGNNGLDLKYAEAKNVWFIIPANTTLAGSYITFTAVVDGKESIVELPQIPTTTSTKTLPVNQTLPVPTISVGTENMVMINNTEDFLKYAFAANYDAKIGLSADPINDSVVAEYYKDGKFKTAVLLADLNYRNYAAQDQYQNALKSDEQDEILLEALKSYMQNGGIEAFSKAASIDGNGHKISYLPVYGNGIFEAAPSLLKDLTIQQATVNVPDGTKTAASFLGRLTSFRNVSGVTISGGSLLNVGEGVTPTLVGASVSASALPTKAQMTVSRYPSVNGVAADYAYYAATLTINADVDASNADKTGFFNTATPRFAKFKGSKDGVIISKVSNATYAKAILDAVDNAGKSFSVMVGRANVSYWTGTVPASVTDDGIVTAEDLAYYVRNGGSVTLTNNIDLQGEQDKEWVLDNGSAALNITGNGKYTISNALVKSQKVTEPYVAYSLLGNVVNAKDIVVDGVTIDVDNVEGSTAQLYVGGIGYQGSANGVKVSNLTIDIAEDVKVSTYNEVGGLISAPTAASEKNAVTDLSINVNGNETVGPVGGMFGVMGKATFDGNSVVYKDAAAVKYPLLGAWTVYGSIDVAACRVCVEDPTNPTNPIVSTEENPIAPVVGVITFNPTNVTPGTQIWLNFDDECSAPYYSEIKNGVDYAYNVKINGKEFPVYKPE